MDSGAPYSRVDVRARGGERLRPIGQTPSVKGGGGGGAAAPGSMEYAMGKQVVYLRRLAWIGIIGLVAIIALLAVILGLGVGAYNSGDLLTRTGEDTHAMRKMTMESNEAVSSWIKGLWEQFPPTQDVTTTRQLLGIVENAHKITSRVEFLLTHVEPETITGLVGHMGTIVSKVDAMLARVSEEEVARFQSLVNHMQELVAGVTPAHVTTLMGGVSETAQYVGQMAKEAEDTHLVQRTADLFAESKNTMTHLNGGQGLSLGWGAVPVAAASMRIAGPEVSVKEGKQQ
jgi:hypothetical protein